MGCNTSKEAVQPVDDSNTGATNENQQSGEKKEQLANSTGLNIPEIGESPKFSSSTKPT
ncbi:hypothetical protein C0J52_16523 [Blattella germanica]|nr:hypothetical protein C0J52_16523 [Blattella germanica]